MEDKKLKDFLERLAELTNEISIKEQEIEEYKRVNKTLPPLNLIMYVVNKSCDLYVACKEYFQSAGEGDKC